MKALDLAKPSSLAASPFWLATLAVALIAIHLTLTWRIDNPSLQVSSLVFWATAASLIWQRRHLLNLEASLGASLLGGGLLVLLLLKSSALTAQGAGLLLGYPFVAGLGLALVASGFKGLRQYWQELTLLFFLGIPELFLSSPLGTAVDPSLLTAHVAAILLWYGGYHVTQQGVFLYLPGGSVEVNPGCSGLVSMTQLLSLSVLFLMVLPLPWHWSRKLLLPLVAGTLGFLVNAVRVALLAIVVAQGSATDFEYWHSGQGSHLFSAIAAGLFVLFVWATVHFSIIHPPDTEAPSN